MTTVTRGCFAATLAAVLLSAGVAASEPDHVQLTAGLGYALPGGNLERGSRASDVTFGLARLDVDGAYRLHPLFSVGVAARYGFSIPTLCGSGSDCVSSLGHDVAVDLLGRWHIGTWGVFVPDVELRFGYEWFVSKDVDGDATAKRSYRGVETAVHGFGAFKLSRVLVFGPAAELGLGIFSHAALDAPGIGRASATDGAEPHLWVTLSAAARATW